MLLLSFSRQSRCDLDLVLVGPAIPTVEVALVLQKKVGGNGMKVVGQHTQAEGKAGNTGSGNFMPFAAGTATGPGAECMSKLWLSTSMRNFGAVATVLFSFRAHS